MEERLPESPRVEHDFTFVSETDRKYFIELFVKVTQLTRRPSKADPRAVHLRKRIDPARIQCCPSKGCNQSNNIDLMTDALKELIWLQQQLELAPQLVRDESQGCNHGMVLYTTVEELEASAGQFINESFIDIIHHQADAIRRGEVSLENSANTLIINYMEGPKTGAITETISLIPMIGPRRDIQADFTIQTLRSLGLENFTNGGAYGYATALDRRQGRSQGTETDFNLLKTLYHPALRPGMAEDEVRTVLDEVLRVVH